MPCFHEVEKGDCGRRANLPLQVCSQVDQFEVEDLPGYTAWKDSGTCCLRIHPSPSPLGHSSSFNPWSLFSFTPHPNFQRITLSDKIDHFSPRLPKFTVKSSLCSSTLHTQYCLSIVSKVPNCILHDPGHKHPHYIHICPAFAQIPISLCKPRILRACSIHFSALFLCLAEYLSRERLLRRSRKLKAQEKERILLFLLKLL